MWPVCCAGLLYAVMTSYAHRFNICSSKCGGRRRLLPPSGHTPGSSDRWLYGFDPFVAIANLLDNTHWRRTDKCGMVRKTCNREEIARLRLGSFRLHHINLSRNAIWWKLTFLLTVVLAEIHGFKLVIDWFSPVFAGLDRSRSIARALALGWI